MGVCCSPYTDLKLEKNFYSEETNKRNNKEIANKKKFKEIQHSIDIYYKDMENKYNLIENYQSFTNKLNSDINDINNNLKLSVFESYNNPENEEGQNAFIDKLKNILNKVYDLRNSLEEIKNNTMRKVERLYEVIHKALFCSKSIDNNDNQVMEIDNNIIKDKLSELEEINNTLKNDKIIHDKKKNDIENDIKDVQNKIKDYTKTIDIFHKSILNSLRDSGFDENINTKFFKNSMLIDIKEFENPFDIFTTKILFKNDDDYENQLQQKLLRKNWNEKCYVYDEYDLHDVNYELKAVGLPQDIYYSNCSFAFYLDTSVEIIEFEIDGKKANYNYNNYQLKFDIHLGNLQSNQIHVKYKESPLPYKLSQGEIKQRKFYKNNTYGLESTISGQKGKYTLIIECDFEVINFKEEFFVKTNDKEYTWGGEVPPEGKKTSVNMSKTKAKFKFNMINRIETINGKPLQNMKLFVPFSFLGGNNEILKYDYSCEQSKNIEQKKDTREYEINFLNIKENYGEFSIKGELINRCKGEWICDLTDEEIEKNIPEDFKYNKEKFKEMANNIIKNYDEIHKNDNIQVPDFVKIGKYLHKNIRYDISYKGRNEISATETWNNQAGVCHHFTKLFNAFMYSLGYKCIYVSGYAMDKKDYFTNEDAHAWSLIKINGKWLPFDATWGIFSGKLPVCHVFNNYFSSGIRTLGTDSIEIKETQIKGEYVD